MAGRATFVIDGFNLYHSIRDIEHDSGVNCRWLDVRALCESIVSSAMAPDVSLASVQYFSAFAHHTDPTGHGSVARHRVFKRALESSGVTVHMSRFKKKTAKCAVFRQAALNGGPPPSCEKAPGVLCNGKYTTWGEKETDVAMACEIMKLGLTGVGDHIVVVSGDTDLLPAVRQVRALRPSLAVMVAFPYGRFRHNKDLANAASSTITLTQALYVAHQFSDPYMTPDTGASIAKPVGW